MFSTSLIYFGMSCSYNDYMMKTLKVFVSEDSVIVKDLLVSMFQALEGTYIAGTAADTVGILNEVQRTQPDVVTLDICMPGGGNGIDVLQALKKMKPAPKVIMLTNYSSDLYRKKCMALGADFFLDKTTEFDKIPKIFKQLRKGDKT